MPTIAEWFCLKEGRDEFLPDNKNDAGLKLCHENIIKDKVMDTIDRSFATNRPVKMLIYGDWGVGKTHTLNHIKWWFEQKDSPHSARVIIVELGDVEKKSKYDVVIRRIMDSLTLKYLIKLLQDYNRTQNIHPVQALKSLGSNHSVAEAFGNLLQAVPDQAPPPAVLWSFNYLKGQEVKEGSSVGLGQTIKEADEFYSVLLCCGELVKKVENKQLIFIVDELAKMEEIGLTTEAESHWMDVNRAILDHQQRTFGFVYSMKGGGDELPDIIDDPQLQSRIGDNRVELRNFESSEVTQYLKKLTEEFVNWEKVQTLVDKGEIDSKEYDKDSYPFTSDSLNHFKDYYERTMEDAKPRNIADKMSTVGFNAIRDKSRFISLKHLQDAGM